MSLWIFIAFMLCLKDDLEKHDVNSVSNVLIVEKTSLTNSIVLDVKFCPFQSISY